MSRANPESDDDFFKQAEKCPDFIQSIGTQISLDVDGDTTIEDYKEDPEVYEVAKKYFGEIIN